MDLLRLYPGLFSLSVRFKEVVRKWVNIGYFDVPVNGYQEGEVTFPLGTKKIKKIIPNTNNFFKDPNGSTPGVLSYKFSLIGSNGILIDLISDLGMYGSIFDININQKETYQYVFNVTSAILGITASESYYYGCSVLIGLS